MQIRVLRPPAGYEDVYAGTPAPAACQSYEDVYTLTDRVMNGSPVRRPDTSRFVRARHRSRVVSW